MGNHVAQKHGDDYRVLAFVFHDGRYNATGGVSMANDAIPSFPGSAEYVFHSTGMPGFILDLRKADPENPDSAWLLGEIEYRDIGAVVRRGFRSTHRLAADFDALIYFDHTTPSALLPF